MQNARRFSATARQLEGDWMVAAWAIKTVVGNFRRVKPRPKSMPEVSDRGPRLPALTPAGYKHAMTTGTALLECRIV